MEKLITEHYSPEHLQDWEHLKNGDKYLTFYNGYARHTIINYNNRWLGKIETIHGSYTKVVDIKNVISGFLFPENELHDLELKKLLNSIHSRVERGLTIDVAGDTRWHIADKDEWNSVKDKTPFIFDVIFGDLEENKQRELEIVD